jgi:hypothetical protein
MAVKPGIHKATMHGVDGVSSALSFLGCMHTQKQHKRRSQHPAGIQGEMACITSLHQLKTAGHGHMARRHTRTHTHAPNRRTASIINAWRGPGRAPPASSHTHHVSMRTSCGVHKSRHTRQDRTHLPTQTHTQTNTDQSQFHLSPVLPITTPPTTCAAGSAPCHVVPAHHDTW